MKYRLAILLLFGLLVCSVSTVHAEIKLKTVVIDAGHGGTDPGCISSDKKTKEKDVVLTVAKNLEKKIKAAYPDVKVVLTRSTDVFVPLNDRADIANKNNADLFISIHVNSVANSSSKTANGFSLHVLGQSQTTNRDLYALNMDLCQRENAVITLEDDYEQTYQGFDPKDPESYIFFSLLQNTNLSQSLIFAEEAAKALSKGPITRNRGISQDPFLVLWRTTMPAVLVEIGFMSNASDLAKLRDASNLDKISEGLFQGFKSFKAKYENSAKGGSTAAATSPAPRTETSPQASSQASSPQPKTTPASSFSAKPAEGTYYGIQIAAGSRKLPENDSSFKGYKATVVKSASSKVYKYIVCTSTDKAKASSELSKVRNKFPDCFLVKVENDEVTRIK